MTELSPTQPRSFERVAALGLSLRGPALALGLSLLVSAVLVALAGVDTATAFVALVRGAFGSSTQIATGLTKATPYLLCATGIALCFRANVINIGGEGQIALGGLAATAVALAAPTLPAPLLVPLALGAGALGGSPGGPWPRCCTSRAGCTRCWSRCC